SSTPAAASRLTTARPRNPPPPVTISRRSGQALSTTTPCYRRAVPTTAIVTGAAGQDGYYLVAALLAEGSAVHATVRAGSRAPELQSLPNAKGLTVHELDITDTAGYRRLLADLRPDELYNLAGLSSVRRSFDEPTAAWQTNA